MDSNCNSNTPNEVNMNTVNNVPNTTMGNPYNAAPQYGTPVTITESPEEKKKRAQIFQSLALPTVLYAVLYTFFLYKNFSSITMPLFILTTIVYSFYCMKQAGITRKKNTYLYMGILLLLSISNAVTGNSVIITLNTIGIALVLICMLLHNYFDDTNWDFGKYVGSIFLTIFGSICCIPDPFSDFSAFRKEHPNRKHKKLLYIVIGIALSIPLLAVIVGLLYSADAVFADLIRNSFDFDISLGTILGILCMFIFAFLSAYCGIRYLGKHTLPENASEHKKWEALIAITVLSLISIVYLIFSVIQIVYLFWGKMQLPAAYTYAQYAREGFFQLLFVCMLNIFIVLFVQSLFQEHVVLKALLAIISSCTYVMIASSAFRMILYIQNYQLTFLRIFVLWMLAAMALVLLGILIQIFAKSFPLFQYSFVIVCICYLCLSFSHVDYFIAKYNLAHMDNSSESVQDYTYLSGLSSDAAPAIYGHTGSWVDAYVYNLADETSASLRKLNVSNAYARHLFNISPKQDQEGFCIELRNFSDTSIQNVGCSYNCGTTISGSAGETYADGTPIVYPNYETVTSQVFGGKEYIYTLTFSSQDFGDLDSPGQLELEFTFEDANGNTHTTDRVTIDAQYGNTYPITLTGDSENHYYVYREDTF